jgi:hypothetical protein
VGEIILKIDKTSEGNQVTLIAERKEKVDTNATSKVVLN